MKLNALLRFRRQRILPYCLGLGLALGFSKTRKYGEATYDKVVKGTFDDEFQNEFVGHTMSEKGADAILKAIFTEYTHGQKYSCAEVHLEKMRME